MGSITEAASSFPGYDSVIPDEAATIADARGILTGFLPRAFRRLMRRKLA